MILKLVDNESTCHPPEKYEEVVDALFEGCISSENFDGVDSKNIDAFINEAHQEILEMEKKAEAKCEVGFRKESYSMSSCPIKKLLKALILHVDLLFPSLSSSEVMKLSVL